MPETGNNPSFRVISLDTAKTVIVPAELFETGMEENYLRFNGMALSDGETAVASGFRGEASDEFAGSRGNAAGFGANSGADSVGNDIVAVMGVSADVWSTVEAGYKRGEVVLTSPLLAIIAKCGERSKREVRIALTGGGNVYIAVWEKGLRMAEVLPDVSIDSLLYYMQVIGRQFALRKFEIFVSGDPGGDPSDGFGSGGDSAYGSEAVRARAKEAAEARVTEAAEALKEYYPKVKVCE